MEFVIIVIAIVYSVWSEIQKQKEEKNLDFDFSDLSSVDDFLKKSPDQKAGQADKPGNKTRKKSEKKGASPSSIEEHGELQLPENFKLPAPLNHDMTSRPEVNYDELNSLTGVDRNQTLADKLKNSSLPTTRNQAPPQSINLGFSREKLIQAFIMSEVMTRYDINRIYERVPGVSNDNSKNNA
ncbi:MAG: hypothetical protein ACOYXC_05035 [Candidatus Rifleibacteriota bacterium]